MANKNFPGPNINRLITNDPQIVKIDEEYAGWGARPSALPKAVSNNMTIKHVGNESK